MNDETSPQRTFNDSVHRDDGRQPSFSGSVAQPNDARESRAPHDANPLLAIFDPLDLPTDRPRSVERHGRLGRSQFSLGETLTQRIAGISRHLGVPSDATLLAAWSTVLSRLSGQLHFVIAVAEIDGVESEPRERIRMPVRVTTARIDLRADPTATESIIRTRNELELSRMRSIAFEPAGFADRLAYDADCGSSLQIMFTMGSGAGRLQRTPCQQISTNASHMELWLALEESAGEIHGTVAYSEDLFDRQTAERWIGCYEALLEDLVGAPGRHVSRLSMLDVAERRRIVEQFNQTKASYSHDKPIHEVFEEQVCRTPAAVALISGDRSLTYAQLNHEANALARRLLSSGVLPGDYVPLVMSRSVSMLIAQLAVLKSGGAYVPVDPELPHQRRAYVFSDCAVRNVLVDENIPIETAPSVNVHVVSPPNPNFGADCVAGSVDDDLSLRISFDAPAYVMYTSGSTGTPKGVVVPHHAVNRLAVNNGYAQIEPNDCIAHYSSPSFDASTFEVWGALLSGARVAVVPQTAVLHPSRFADLLRQHRVTILYMSVGLFNQYTDALAEVFRGLKYLMVGGDSLDPAAIQHMLMKSRPRLTLNAYGPTECTTFTTTYLVEAVADGATQIPIGRPMSNARVYILDSHRQVVPVGVAGELYVGGAGVACGYLNRPELSAERFVPDPFGSDPGRRLYRTGDLGRWRADGVVEFLGRNDHQVKIRGFRIEPGEIEARLATHPYVQDAIVIAREDDPGDKRLVAYVVGSSEQVAGIEELRAHLRSTLPEHMIPSAFVTLPKLPLTVNGKIDRRALPMPGVDAYSTKAYEAPLPGAEQLLARVWQDLLRVERVSRLDNFFELGGNSLLLVRLLDALRRADLGTEPKTIYNTPNLAALARALTPMQVEPQCVPPNLIPTGCERVTPQMLPLVALEQSHIDHIVSTVPGGGANLQDVYPLLPLQEGILFHHLLDQQRGDTYVLPTLLIVASAERLRQLIQALQRAIDRHDVLRTAVLWEDLPQPLQVVHRRAALPVEEVSLDASRDALEQAREWIKPERQRMDLRRAPLVRMLIAADPAGDRWFALLQLHHLTIDHVTEEIVISDVVADLRGEPPSQSEATPYREHVAQALAYARNHDATAFFRGKLAHITEPSAPFGLFDVHGDGTQVDDARADLEPELSRRVRAQARRLGVSAATIFHAAWGLVVARTTGHDEVVFGSLLLGRMHGSAGARRIMGIFINTLPLALRVADVTAEQLVRQTQQELVELLEYEQASLAEAQRCSGVSGSSPLFSTLLNYRHSAPNPLAHWSSAEGIRAQTMQEWTNYPITLSIDDLGEGFVLTAQTDKRMPPERVIGYMSTALRSLVKALEAPYPTPAAELSIVPQSERRKLLEFGAAEYRGEARVELIHERFQEVAHRFADRVALVCDGQPLTYAELNSRANQLARHLIALGVGSDQLVALCMDRSLNMVVSLIAILKAGGAYVPLDPDYPAERLTYILRDACPKVVLTQRHLLTRLSLTNEQTVIIDEGASQVALYPADDLDPAARNARSEHRAYVIYTSGSTGKPKGVMVEHRNVVRLFDRTASWFNFDESDVWTLFHSIAFDFSVWELWGGLLYGGRVVIVPQVTARSSTDFYELLCEQSVTVLNQTPSAFAHLIDAQAHNQRRKHALRLVIFGGEALDFRLLRPWVKRHSARHPQLVNMYGITETTVHVTYRLLTEPEIESEGGSLIGRPIPDLSLYLLDRGGQLAPLGVIGEIHVGGSGVARGYLNRPELTAQRFIANPFAEGAGAIEARLYKSGDLGRWREDGTLEYLGRNDHQVKIRGFRIELGEIETQLALHDQVKAATVMAREDVAGEKRLVAYVIPRDPTAPPTAAALRAYLCTSLPDHMLPSAFVSIERVPLTAHGKLDRRSLPVPQSDAFASREYEAPQGEVESGLAEMWLDLLRLERVGRGDSFFELGGHSLLAMQLLARVRKRWSVELPMRALFAFPTVHEFAARVQERRSARLSEAIADNDEGEIRDLLERVDSLTDDEAQALLRDLRREESHG